MRWAGALVCLACASACLQVPDYEGKACSQDAPCPGDLVCGSDFVCRRSAVVVADASAAPEDAAEPVADAAMVVEDASDAGIALDAAEDASAEEAGADASPAADAAPLILDAGDPRLARCMEPQASPVTGWQARHFNLDARNAFTTCVGVEDLPGDDLSRDFGMGGPYPGLVDRFGTRYTAKRTFRAGVYTFQIDHDDGLRIYVDGDLVYERWEVGTRMGVVARTRYLAEGEHDIVVEHFDDTGAAKLEVRRVLGCMPLLAPTAGWNIYYFRLAPGNVIDTSVCYGAENLRTDGVALDWGTGAPRPVQVVGLVDNFAVVGVASRRFEGMTRFSMSHDDGMRVRVGNRVIYDGWAGPAAGQSATAYVTGDNIVRFELFDVVANANVSLSWAKVCDGPIPTGPDLWFAAYYRVVQDAMGIYALDRSDCLGAEPIAGATLVQDFMASAPQMVALQGIVDRFGAEYTAVRTFTAATQATVFHDDGMRVYAGTSLLYERWLAPNVSSGSLILPAGTQLLRVQWFENQGGAQVSLRW